MDSHIAQKYYYFNTHAQFPIIGKLEKTKYKQNYYKKTEIV